MTSLKSLLILFACLYTSTNVKYINGSNHSDKWEANMKVLVNKKLIFFAVTAQQL